MELNKIYEGNCLDVLRTFKDKNINCCVTSPPYYGLRDYGVDEQIGLEVTPEQYIQKLVEVFREVKRVLKDDGTLWINIGDSYAGSGKGAWNSDKQRKETYRPTKGDKNIKMSKTFENIKAKDLIGIPWMLAFALRADGWYLRQDIIWNKPNAMPESVKDRCTKSHEYIFLFSKSKKYHFDNETIMEPCVSGDPNPPRGSNGTFTPNKGRRGSENKERKQRLSQEQINRGCQAGSVPWEFKEKRNKRDVWTVSTKPYKGAHFATFPPDLIEPCILAGCPEGGIVIDPFLGSGTTGMVAVNNKRNFLGIELNSKYCDIAEKRIKEKISQITV